MSEAADNAKKPDTEALKLAVAKELESPEFEEFMHYFENNYKPEQKRGMKNPARSTRLRLKARKLITSSDTHDDHLHIEAWRLSTQSLALARPNSDELALGYAVRSAILMHIGQYRDCLKDVNRALAVSGLDLQLEVELLCRRMSCATALGDFELKHNTWRKILGCSKRKNKAKVNKQLAALVRRAKEMRMQVGFSCAREEPEKSKVSLDCCNDAVVLKKNPKTGNNIVASRYIRPGEVVACWKPYVTSVNLNKSHAYCSHCLAFSWSLVPCDYCRLSMYCSENCKDEAWFKYHHMECLIMTLVKYDNVEYHYCQMSLRAIIMGIHEFEGIEGLKRKVEEFDEVRAKCRGVYNEDYKSFWDNSFLSLYGLLYKCDGWFYKPYIKRVCHLMIVLTQAASFFKDNVKSMSGKELTREEDVMFISTLFLKTTMIAVSYIHYVNIGTIQCEAKKSLSDCFENCCCVRGASILPFDGLMNHDCYPNVGKCLTSDGKMVYYANQPIKKFKQINFTWFNRFYENDKQTRQKLLSKKNITCVCKACSDDWPLMQDLFHRFQVYQSNQRFKQNLLSQKLLPKYTELDKIFWDRSYYPDQNELQSVAEDVTEAVQKCQQPSFILSMLIEILSSMCEDVYGDVDFDDVPTECHSRKDSIMIH